MFSTGKKVTAFLLAVLLLLGVAVFPVSAKTDEELITEYRIEDNWARPALLFALRNGLLTGKDTGLCPTDCITRSEVAAILMRILGTTVSADLSVFSDADPDAWYYDTLSRACAAGIFSGCGDGTVRPAANITRQEAAAVICRVVGLTGGMLEELYDFRDGKSVSIWARPAMMAMVHAGHLKGSSGCLNPLSDITRQEFAQILYSIFDGIGEITGRTGTFVLPDSSDWKDAAVQGDLILCGEAQELCLSGLTVSGRLVIQGCGAMTLRMENCTADTLVLCRPCILTGTDSTVQKIVTLARSEIGLDCTLLEVHADTLFTATAFSSAAVQGTLTLSDGGTVENNYSSEAYRQAQETERVRIYGGTTKEVTMYKTYREGGTFEEPIGTVKPGTKFLYYGRYESSARITLPDGTHGYCRYYDIFVYGDKTYIDKNYPTDAKECYVNYIADYDSTTEYLIWINRRTLKFTVFSGSKGRWKAEKTFTCALGRNSSPTPEGIRRVTNKTPKFEAQDFFYHHVTWLGNAHAIHSRLYNYDGTFYDDSMTETVSHGCVRLEDENAIWIYDNIPIGTSVAVY